MDDDKIYKGWVGSYIHKDTKNHPSKVYESEHMSSIDLPKLEFSLNLKPNRFDLREGISDVQIEAVAYAVNTMYDWNSIDNNSRGFFLGDGTGVGKSRTIAGIFSELYMIEKEDYRGIWVSLNKNLEVDARNELEIVKNIGNECPEWLKLKDLKNGKNGVYFTTYGSMIRDETYDIVLNWLENSINTILIFDEAHSAKNSNSKCGKMVVELQEKVYNPKVVYSTATAASDIRQMHYMTRLGLWSGDHYSFVKLLESYGSSAMEMAALQLKHSGKLISRQLGFDGVLMYVKSHNLTKEEIEYYDKITNRWKTAKMEAENSIVETMTGIDNLNFYQHLITSFKINTAIKEIELSLERGESVVIGLQTTGEACYKRNEGSDLHSCILDLFIRNGCDTSDILFKSNPIDILIDKFGQENVAEISGRSRRPIRGIGGNIVMEKVPSLKSELFQFQNDKKKIAIITKSGSAGISLHGNKKDLEHCRKRHHIILEPPRSAELLVQQFGRTNRTNSDYPPKYTIIVTNIPSEIRFFYGLTSKLERLGALTKGDRRASILNNLNFEGCSNINTKSYRFFMLELNVEIGRHWYFRNKSCISDRFSLTKIMLGLYGNDHILSNEVRAITYFTKILSNLNNYIVGMNDLITSRDVIEEEPAFLRWSSNEWTRIWNDISKGVSYRLSNISLTVMLKSIWQVLPEYILKTKSWFKRIEEWSPNNNKDHSKYVRNTVETILLCKLRPECTETFGRLPTHLIHEIIPWLIPRNDIDKLSVSNLNNSFKNGAHSHIKSGGIQYFLNKMLEFPIDVQKIIFPILRFHTSMNKNSDKGSVEDISKHILGNKNKKNYNIVYERFEETDRSYDITISAKPIYSQKDYENKFKYLKRNFKYFVRHKSNVNKFGMIVGTSPNSQWFCELWYPGHVTPSRCFLSYQWEHEKDNYKKIEASDLDWIESVNKVYKYKERIAKKFSHTLIFSVKNAISRWERSTGKLIRVKDTGICPDFIGLLIRQKRIV